MSDIAIMSSKGSHEISSSEKQAVEQPVVKEAPLDAKQAGEKEKTVHNAALYAAIKEANINPRSKESFHLYFSIFVAFCCACANGYDGSLMTGILAMQPFLKQFDTEDTGSKVSVIFSLYTV